jgi:hypothetical protein
MTEYTHYSKKRDRTSRFFLFKTLHVLLLNTLYKLYLNKYICFVFVCVVTLQRDILRYIQIQ